MEIKRNRDYTLARMIPRIREDIDETDVDARMYAIIGIMDGNHVVVHVQLFVQAASTNEWLVETSKFASP